MDFIKTPDATSRADCNENRMGWDQYKNKHFDFLRSAVL